MGYDMNKPGSMLGLWLLGGAVACGIVYTANTITWKAYYSGTAAGVTMASIAFYFTIASVICLLLGVILVLLLGRSSEANPRAKWPVIVMTFLTFIILAIAFILPDLI